MKITVKEKVLGLEPGVYTVVGKKKGATIGPLAFSDTIVKDKAGKKYSIPTGNAQTLGLLPLSGKKCSVAMQRKGLCRIKKVK
jgi:hypothetical protein